MLDRIKQWRTSALGVLVLVSLASKWLVEILSGQAPTVDFQEIISAAGGVGLLASKD